MPYSTYAEVQSDRSPTSGRQAPSGASPLSALLIAGVFLRLFHFFDNRSLWLDEIYLAINIISSGFADLTAPLLQYQQKAPVGFLWMVKSSVLLFGNQEQALRLIPLFCGIASLYCFVPVCRYWLKPAGQLAAIGILAFAPPLIYHAVEIKQYSMELLATVLCLWLYVRFKEKKDLRSRLLWGAYGALILWFSYSSVFILTGIGASVCLSLLSKRNWQGLQRALLPFSLWFCSFAIHYVLITSKQNEQEWLLYWFRHYNSFMPLWPTDTLSWLSQHLYTMLDYPLGMLWNFINADHTALRVILRMSFIPLILGIGGAYAFFKTDKPALLLTILPLILTLLASALELYPFFERLLVFLSPLLILLIARGCDEIMASIAALRRGDFVLPALLILGGFTASVGEVINPDKFGRYKKSYQREALLHINDNYKEGDVVYLYWNMEYAYRYYKEAYHLKYTAAIGQDMKFQSKNPAHYIHNLQKDFKDLQGKRRVWVVYNKKLWNDIGEMENQPAWYNQSQPGEFLFRALSQRSRETEQRKYPEVNVHLFDLSSAQ